MNLSEIQLLHQSKIDKLKIELESQKELLKISYEYKDDLFRKLIKADENISHAQMLFFKKVNELNDSLFYYKLDLDNFIENQKP